MKKKKKNKIIILILIVFFMIIGILAGSYFFVKSELRPAKAFIEGQICGEEAAPCEVTPFVIDEGIYGKAVLDKLEAEGIIRNSQLAYYYNRIFTGYSFPAGYFEIPHQIDGQNIDLKGVMAFLSDPKNAHQDTVTISFKEGGLLREYAKQIGEATTVSYNEILDYWNDENVVRGYMNEYPFLTEEIFQENVRFLLEGYLFPDTYEFFEYTSCDEITRKMLDQTNAIYQKYRNDFAESEFSVHEIFTLASIVQGETGNIDDAPLVAGVFVDRYNAPEVMASTVTSCYAFDLTKQECDEIGEGLDYTQQYDPYNTYTIMGFPPGPVNNPNEVSIAAALHPDTSEGYFYFCANYCDGGTVFARTLSEHMANIKRYMNACLD